MASKRPRSVSPRVVRSLQSFAPELADLARYELSKRGMCSSVVLGNLDDDDFVLLRRCLPDPMWSVLPHVVLEARIACKQQVRGIRQSGYTPPVESIAATSSRSVVAVLDPRSRPLPKVAKLKPSVAPIPAVPDSEVARKKKAIRFLFDKFCKAGEAGDKWGHVYSLSAQDRDLHFALWEEQLMTTGISTLVAAQSTLRALCKDAESAGISPFNLPVHWIANWLKSHRERGPTVPLNSLNSLKWLHAHLGFRFHVSEELVLAFGAAAGDHEVHQAEPMPLGYWLKLCDAAESSNDFVRILAITWLGLLQGCLRFAHWQRSAWVTEDVLGMKFRCSAGKRKVKGVRVAYNWVLPRTPLRGTDMLVHMKAYLQLQFGSLEGAGYLLKDMGPACRPLAALEHLVNRPMGRSRFSRLSQQLFRNELGMPHEMAMVLSQTYSARRTLPTIGGCLDMSTLKLASIGNWQSGAMSRDVAQEVARLQMPIRYNDAKQTLAARAKCEAIIAARLCAGSPALTDQFPWKLLVLELASGERLTAAVDKEIASYSSVPVVAVNRVKSAPEYLASSSSSGSSSTSGSSSSDMEDSGHSSAADAQSTEALQDAICNEGHGAQRGADNPPAALDQLSPPWARATQLVQWYRSSGRRGRLHVALVTGEGALVPASANSRLTVCGRCLRQPEVGAGLAEARGTAQSWSPRCKTWLERHGHGASL